MRGGNPPAVLLGGEAIALSVARSLGKVGVPVYALGDATWDPVQHSRHCTAFVDVGARERVGERYLDWLRTRGPRGAVLLPCDDDSLELVARNRAELTELGYVPIEANDEALLAVLDKHRTYELAREVGVPTPRTVTIRTAEDVGRAVAELEFPCALKPVHSHQFAAHFGARKKVWLIRDRAELERTLTEMVALDLEMLATEVIPGGEDRFFAYYSYLDEKGEPLVHFTKQKLRQYPIGFGLGTYHVTVWHPRAAQLGLRFLQGVGIRGLAYVEFKLDPRDDELKMIECNHRFSLANEVVTLAGVDFPLLTYNRLLGRPLPAVNGFREGVRIWHPVEDGRAFLAHRRRGNLTAGAWAKSLLHRQHFVVFRWTDPKPALANWRRLARNFARRLVPEPRKNALELTPPGRPASGG